MKNERGAVSPALIVIGSIVLLLVVGLGIYFLIYASAETRGRIALHNQQRSATELQASYEYFHDTCRTVIAQGQQITTLGAQVKAMQKNPPANDPFGNYQNQLTQLQTQLTGLSNVRDSTAQEYNAKSHEFTHNFMRSKDLPNEIGPPDGVAYTDLKCEG